MSAIAYITDSKMLEYHRLSSHDTINFWRPSANIGFSEFTIGDLVFFLSKDKEHRKGSEKGIVGFGRTKKIEAASVNSMWKKYDQLNGYKTETEFKEAIRKVTKDGKLPNKISSFYLENVCFFQPVYLSECGMQISRNVESYIYLKPEEVVFNLLKLAKASGDLWTDYTENNKKIRQEENIYALFQVHNKIKDIPYDEKTLKKANKTLKKQIDYELIQNSENEAYRCTDNGIEILFFNDNSLDSRLLLGQACLYNYYLKKRETTGYSFRFFAINKEGNKESLFKEI